jgi:TRAP-type C4-dicarboxylate transport system permease small subunit
VSPILIVALVVVPILSMAVFWHSVGLVMAKPPRLFRVHHLWLWSAALLVFGVGLHLFAWKGAEGFDRGNLTMLEFVEGMIIYAVYGMGIMSTFRALRQPAETFADSTQADPT